MRALNCTGRHLTGADRRNLARQWRAHRRYRLASRVRSFGVVNGTELARRQSRAEEDSLREGAAVASHNGRISLEFLHWPEGEPLPAQCPVVRF